MSSERPPIIGYADPTLFEPSPFLDRMMIWRSRCGTFVLAMLLLMFLSMLFPKGGQISNYARQAVWVFCPCGAILSTIFSLFYMSRAAVDERSMGYAARQLMLAVILSIFFLLGVFFVPLMVQADLNKARLAKSRRVEDEIAKNATRPDTPPLPQDRPADPSLRRS